ncbi:hypothetical protein ACLVWU_01080 [Bdellovibrio sp. HCB290]|uniref:hypothetical protein n=1 Tax=Bdellovibrio sp. HCB290 TaxID=3394356 RepID=UPI0039B445C7
MKLLALILALLTVVSCTTPSKPVSQLSSLDIVRINELFRIQKKVAKDVWPGFENAEFRFVVIERTNQFAINVNPLPDYYTPTSLPKSVVQEITSVAKTEVFRDAFGNKQPDAPAVLYNAYSKEMTGMHFKHSIYFVKSLDEYHRSGDKQTTEEWIHISFHELFHTYQDQFVNYDSALMKEITTPIKREIAKDDEHRKLVKKEVELLGQAACSASMTKTKANLKKALQLRSKRWAFLEKKYAFKPLQWERYDAWAEGTADYVELHLMSKFAFYQDDTLLKSDPFFDGFKEYKKEIQQAWCELISSNKKQSYWYSLGFAYALILDKLMPDWKTKKLDSKLFFDAYFKELKVL